MNLKSRRVRLPIAVLGACALAVGGGALTAGPASAVGETLSFSGATGNAASTVAGAMNSALAPTAYGVKVNGLTGNTRPLKIEVLSGPTGGLLAAERIAANGAPNGGTFTGVTNGAGATPVTVTTTTGSKTVTFSAAPTTTVPANISLDGQILRFGAAPAVQYAIVSGHTAGTTTATLSVAAITSAAGQAAATSAGPTFITTPVQPSTPSADYTHTIPALAAGDNLYVGAAVAGTYSFRLFADTADDGVYQANADDTTPNFTLTVKSPADAFALTAPTTVTAGTAGVMAKVAATVSTSDIRGGSPGALGNALRDALGIGLTDNGIYSAATTAATTTGSATLTFASHSFLVGDVIRNASNVTVGTATSVAATTVTLTANAAVAVASGDTLNAASRGVTGDGTGTTVLNTTTDGLHRYLGSSSTQALALDAGTPKTLTSAMSYNGTAITGATRTTEIVSNNVSTLPLAVKAGQTANVAISGATATVRVGTADVTYTATARDSAGAVLAGKDVTFTLTGTSGTTASSDLKANDVAVPTNGQVVVTTGSDGVATLKVTSTKTANSNAYSVAATSGTASGTTITSTYATTAVTTVTATNVTAVVGGTSVLAGKVVDQFGEPYSASGLTAALAVTGSATPATGNFTIGADGKFSATVNDTTSNTTPRNDTFTWTVSAVSSGSKTLAWRTSITPGAIAISSTTIAGSGTTDTAIPFTSSTTKVDLATSGAFTGDLETVKGTVTDTATTPAALPFAEVMYSGSDGVWFYDADNKLVKTMTATATSLGKLSYDGTTDGIRVLFTKTGDATITAKSGSVTKDVTVAVEASTDAYKVIAIDVTGRPGSTITVQGKATDPFGNPATGRKVTLALSAISAGNFTGTDADTGVSGFQVVTDDQGVWSTPFASTSNQSGSVTLTVTMFNSGNTAALTVSPTMNPAWATAGVTIGGGEYQDTATVKTAAVDLKLVASPKLSFGSTFYARGALLTGSGADANATVEIHSKLPGGTYGLVGSVKADASGKFRTTEKISKSTFFLAKSSGASSNSSGTKVYSGVILTGKSTAADRVTLSANGGPNATTTATFYRVLPGGVTIKLGSKMTNGFGNVSATFAAPTGARTFKVIYKAPGTTAGSDTAVVRVR